jgi:histidine triad (HIT) family protein
MPLTEEDLKNLSPEEIAELQKRNCIFCQIATGKIPGRKVYEDEKCIAVLDISPANLGHMLLFPKEHYSVMPQLPDELTGHLFSVAKKLSQSALKAFKVRGTTIFVANGIAAGQKAPHVLIHIIPRAFEDGIDLSLPQNAKEEDQKPFKEPIRAYLQKFGSIRPTPKKEMPKKGVPEKEAPKEGKIAKVGVKKEKGYLYFVDKQGDVARAKMAKGKTRTERTPKKKKTARKREEKNVDLDEIGDLFK